MSMLQVKVLPALENNYMYLIIDASTREAAVVDPVQPEIVLAAVRRNFATLNKVLITHHHWDHAGGNKKLVRLFPKSLKIYGGDDRIDELNFKVKDNYSFKIGSLKVRCLFTPCHTNGDYCYFVEAPNGERALFSGDTLFQGGCGRFFEGTAQQMYAALYYKLGKLPNDTKVYCGHEYTLKNMVFALHVEPRNECVQKRYKWAQLRRANEASTIPSTIGQEKTWNPFMRVHLESVQNYVNQTDPVKTMRSLREEKDHFKDQY